MAISNMRLAEVHTKGGEMMSMFFNALEGAELRDNTERAVEELFSSRYNVRSVSKIGDRKYYVYLRDGKFLTVKTNPHTTMFGRQVTTVTYVSD